MDLSNYRQSPFVLVMLAVLLNLAAAGAADWPQFGRDATRNAVSPEWNPPTSWDIGKVDDANARQRIVGTSKNVKWSARLGTLSFGDPVVADGLIWIGTNNGFDPKLPKQLDASVLSCFRESDGKLLYRYVSPRLESGRAHDWPYAAMACSPFVEKDRIWFVTNRAEVVCLDITPLHRDGSEPKPVWKVEMMAKFGVYPRAPNMALAHLCSIAGYRDFIYVITGNGANESRTSIPKPEAPSLICFNKHTGEDVWQDNSPGANILDGQSSSPTIIEVNGRAQCLAPQGDGWLRSFDALTGKPIWQFDMNRKESRFDHGGRSSRNSILATAVYYDNLVYLASGQNPESGEGAGRLVCVDPARQGDISAELAIDAAGQVLPHRRIVAADSAKKEQAVANPNSGLVWEFTRVGDGKVFTETMHRSVSNVAAHNGLVIAADASGLVHCLDAKTGKRHWEYDTLSGVFGSPLIVDNKVYVADEDGDVTIFGLSSDKDVALRKVGVEYQPLQEIAMGDSSPALPFSRMACCTLPPIANSSRSPIRMAPPPMRPAATGPSGAGRTGTTCRRKRGCSRNGRKGVRRCCGAPWDWARESPRCHRR